MDKYQKNLINFLKSWKKDSNLAFVKKLLQQFKTANVFLVGGMVRDLAMGIKSVDYDLVVQGVSKIDLEKFLKKAGWVDLVGKRFGVYKFLPSLKYCSKSLKKSKLENAIDIALPRTEHSFNTGGYRDQKIKSNPNLPIEKDLERRDFTINSIALTLQAKSYQLQVNIIDPFNGLGDIKNQIIRCVGQPADRFKEDYSRMLRALRLACQLNFEIETKTWQAILKKIKNLNKKALVIYHDRDILPERQKRQKRQGERVVPYEVIAKELVKMIKNNPVWTLELLDKSGAIKILMPELLKMKRCPQPKEFHSEGDVWQHTILCLEKLNSQAFKKEFPKIEIPQTVIWGLLFHDIGKPYTITMADRLRFNEHDIVSAKMFRKIADRLKLSSAGLDVEVVEKIIAKHMLATHSKANEMKDITIEKYFFSPNFPGLELLMLIFADISATIPLNGKPDFSCYKKIKKRIENLKKKCNRKVSLPREILNGNEIMKILKIKPGPEIKKIKEYLREKQLRGLIKTKVQAKKEIKKFG